MHWHNKKDILVNIEDYLVMSFKKKDMNPVYYDIEFYSIIYAINYQNI